MTTAQKTKGDKVSLGKIQSVDPAQNFTPDNPAWVGVLKAFNPLGHIAEAYAKTLAYRIEVKRLEVEMERVQAQAAIMKQAIDANLTMKMEQLRQRQVAMLAFYHSVNKQLDRMHIERMKVLEMIELATTKALADGVSLDERKLFSSMASEMTKQLSEFGVNANGSLRTLVKSLPRVEIETILLSGSEDS
jgi:hypothetical protein